MNTKNKIFFLIIFSLFFSLQIYSQMQNFRHFSLKDGLPDASVSSITQINKGYIYFGTENGLSQFDGKSTTNFTTSDGLIDNYINEIITYKKNKLLIGTNSGISIFDGGKFTNFTEESGLSNNLVHTIFNIGKEYLIGTNSGISIFSDGKIYNDFQNGFFDSLRINAFAFDSDRILYIGTSNGLFKILNDSVISVRKNIIVRSLLTSSDGILYCGADKGLYKVKNNLLEQISKLSNIIIYDLFEDDSKRIWLGTNQGIYQLLENNINSYASKDGFLGNSCYSIFQDEELNLWFASEQGVNLYDNGLFQLYNRRDGVKSTVWAIYQTKKGNFWIATDGNGVLGLRNNEFVQVPVLKNLPKTIWNIFEDSNNNVWFATSKGAVKLNSKNELEFFNKNSGFTDDMVYKIFEDKEHNIWLTTAESGIYKYAGNKFTNIILPNAKLLPTFNIIEDSENSLWFASSGGLDKIENGEIVVSPLSNIFGQHSFYSINFDSVNNNLLLGSYNRGLVIYDLDSSSFTSITKYDGLNDNAILFLKFDKDKSHLWIGTNQGLCKFSYQNFLENGTIKIKSYNSYDGFPGIECNQIEPIYDNNNQFWFSTREGIVKYDKTKEKEKEFLSVPYISSIEINYKDIELTKYGVRSSIDSATIENIEFPYNMNNITINFSALYYSNPLNVKFKYRLHGIDEIFSPLTKNNYVTYSSLLPGNYEFELVSFSTDITTPSKPIYFTFSIETLFWKSSYFFIAVFLAFILGLYLIYRIRTATIRKKNLELLNLYRENISYQSQLVKSEKDYKGLFENAHSAILIIDPETFLIIDANHSAELLYGYKRSELVDLSTKVLSISVRSINELVDKVIKNGGIKKYKTTHLKKDGSEIILNVNASITNYKGNVAIISLHRDITEEEEIKKQLLLAKEIAEKSNKLKSEFLAQISHEIRTPINTILGYVSLIKEIIIDSNDDEVRSLFPPIKRSSARIIRTIDLILEMSDVNAGTFDLNIQEINIESTLEEIVIEQRQNAKKKGLKLVFIDNSESATLFIDEYTFTQIFVNLIDNAIKYTEVGNIDVVLSKSETAIIIKIIDTGIGISEEYIPFLFDSFSQEEQGYTRKYEGNGLGLALVKNYVKINKGEISVDSEKGKGTTFKVEFPTQLEK